MVSFLLWYLTLTLLGLITFPLAFWLLPGLPDRGYAFSRTLGLLVWAFVFWMLASLGVLGNNPGGLMFALIVVLILSGWAATRIGVDGFRAWWQRQRGAVLVGEVLFLVAFGLMTYLRGANPDLASTEKPMELMFINSILRSPTFPPHDAWLSGYAISYYYFGYVMAAMLAMLTNVTAPVAFSLMLATVFALGGMGAWGVAYNLLASEQTSKSANQQVGEREYAIRNTQYASLALLAPLFVLLVSNAEAFLEVLHARGIGWSNGQSAFWPWLNVKDLINPPDASLSWPPANRGWGWWWRASRVVNDVSYSGAELEIIDEFPFFSFLLGDLHPHVLAIPFAFLAMGLALNVFLSQEAEEINLFGFRLHLGKFTLGLAALALGGLAFLNTWDFPIYLALFAGAYALKRAGEAGWAWGRLADFAGLGAVVGGAGVVLYLPFYVGFSSQAGGFLPNLLNPTRGAHLWVMFGTLLMPLFLYLVFHWRETGGRLGQGLWLGAGFVLLLLVFALAVGGLAALTPAGQQGINLLGAPDAASFLREGMTRRVTGIAGVGTLIALFGLAVAGWLRKDEGEAGPVRLGTVRPGTGAGTFAGLMILIGTLLVIGPEFVYLRDQFGWRMNTVFKFYYQTWLLWGAAAGYGAAVLLKNRRGAARAGVGAAIVLSIGIGLFYPVLGMPTRTNNFQNPWTLDGIGYSHLSGDDVAAVEWLKAAPMGTLVEAVGGSYSGYARMSGHSGLPTVLGWPGHEAQWRGGYEEQGTREGDVETIYRTGSWSQTETLLQQYNVRYIVVGNLERATYGVNETKFRRYLTPVFEQGSVVIFEYEGGE
jgi:YYY domain-containing protein